MAVLQALLGFCSEARWLRYAHAHLGQLFPYLPKPRVPQLIGVLGYGWV